MNVEQLRRVRRLFQNDMVPSSTVRHNQRQWVLTVRQLGDRWLLANPAKVQKLTKEIM